MRIEAVLSDLADFLPELNGEKRQRLHRLLLAYGAACAAQERARCAAIAEQYRYPHGPADDEHRGAYIMRDYIAAAIRATPGEPG